MNNEIYSKHFEAIYSVIAASGQRVHGFFSAEASQGKALIVMQLAKRIAASGQSVLLVNTAADPLMLDDNFSGNISVIHPGNDLALCLSLRELDQCRDYLQEKTRGFDHVLLNTSALNDYQAALPAQLVARAVEQVLFVVKSGEVTEMSLSQAFRQLDEQACKVAAVIMNDQQNPSLGDEMIRELQRIEKLLPGLVKKLSHVIKQSTFLNAYF